MMGGVAVYMHLGPFPTRGQKSEPSHSSLVQFNKTLALECQKILQPHTAI